MPGKIDRNVLEVGDVRVAILSIGCAVQDWRVAHDGQEIPVVLGFDDIAAYHDNPHHFGAIAGRVANRTGYGQFSLDGQSVQLDRNQPPHHLHGGKVGLGRHIWDMEPDGARAVRLRYRSPDGEDRYPGAVDFEVVIRLDGHRLSYEMTATPDRPTPVSLAQHTYYNLAGTGDARDHRIWIDAPFWTPTDETLLPSGEIAPVEGSRYDFRTARSLDDMDPDRSGTDINLMLRQGRPADMPAAEVEAATGLRLRLWTDRPALQLYDAMHLGQTEGGLDGRRYDRFGGLCLEPQFPPDTLNQPEFGSILCAPDMPYRQQLAIEIAPRD